MGKKGRKVKKDVFSAFCDKHPKHAIEMFCVDCDKLVCVICQATEHKSGDHTMILTIEEASIDCAETKEFLEYKDKLNTVFTRGNETLAENNKLTSITDQLKKEAESLIKKHKQDLIDQIEKHHKKLYESNNLKYEQSKKRLHSVNKQLCKNKNKTAEIHQEIDAKQKSGQSVALFIAMKKSQDNLRQIDIELKEIEKSNFVERYEFQAGHMVRQLLEEEKEFGDLLVMATKSPKVSPRELQPRGVFVLPRQSIDTRQAEVADKDEQDGYVSPRELKPRGGFELPRQSNDTRQTVVVDEDEQDDYEPVEQYAGNGPINDQRTPQEPSPRRDSTQSLNVLFNEETNQLKRFSGDIFKYPSTECMDPDADDEQYDSRMPPDAAAPPIENKPSPGPIRRRRKTLHESYDTVQLREIEQTHTPGSPILSTEREQEAHTDPAFHVQSGHDTISVPQQKPEKYIALYDYEPISDDDMEIKAGQVVTVWEKCGDWFCGEASGRYGYFPGNYVQKAEDTAAPPIAKKPSPDTILRRRSMLDIRTDTIPTHYVHRRDIVQTQLPEASGRRGNIPGNYLRKAAQNINPGADFTNELEKALLRRRAKSEEISSSNE